MTYDVDAIAQEVVTRVAAHYRALGTLLFTAAPPAAPKNAAVKSPLRQAVEQLVRVANGEIARDKASVAQVARAREALDRVLQALWAPGAGELLPIPTAFWGDRAIGSVCLAARLWLQQDELLNYTEAGRLLFADADERSQHLLTGRVAHLVQNGRLTGYAAPDAQNPRHAQRVLRSEVERYRAAASTGPVARVDTKTDALRAEIRRRLLAGESSGTIARDYGHNPPWAQKHAMAGPEGLVFFRTNPQSPTGGRWVTRAEAARLEASRAAGVVD